MLLFRQKWFCQYNFWKKSESIFPLCNLGLILLDKGENFSKSFPWWNFNTWKLWQKKLWGKQFDQWKIGQQKKKENLKIQLVLIDWFSGCVIMGNFVASLTQGHISFFTWASESIVIQRTELIWKSRYTLTSEERRLTLSYSVIEQSVSVYKLGEKKCQTFPGFRDQNFKNSLAFHISS